MLGSGVRIKFLLNPIRPLWGTLSSLHPLYSLAVDTALLFPIWGRGGDPAQLHRVLVLSDMVAGRQAQPWFQVSLSPDGHWLLCSPSELAADSTDASSENLSTEALLWRPEGKESDIYLPVLPDLWGDRVLESQDSCVFICHVHDPQGHSATVP